MVKSHPSLKVEKKYWQTGLIVAGVDEVGRGCIAGPVVASAVSFSKNHKMIFGVTDSKQLTAKNRELLAPQIKDTCKEYAIGEASVDEINTLGIVKATFLAMERALLSLQKVDVILVDGNQVPRFQQLIVPKIETIIKGDQLSYSIAAASIIAKVYRDQFMEQLHHSFQHFNWQKNKGYGTAQHRDALLQYGITPHHRVQFCETILRKKNVVK